MHDENREMAILENEMFGDVFNLFFYVSDSFFDLNT